METQIYKVRDPSGAIREIRGPVGASDEDIIAKSKALFSGENAVSPTPTSEPSMLSKLNPMNNPLVRGAYGLAEGGTNMLTGMGGMALGGIRGLASIASGEGVDEATRKIQGLAESVTYDPRTAEGTVASKALALPMEGLSALGKYMGRNSGIAELTGTQDTAESIGEVAPQIAGALLGGRSAMKSAKAASDTSAAMKLSENIRKSELDAPRIEAAQLADKYGIAINPAQSNPSFGNTLRAKVAGEKKMSQELHEANQYKPVQIIRSELGIEGTGPISMADINKVKAEAAKPKEAIKQIAEFSDDGSAISDVRALKQDTMIGGKGVAKKLNGLIADAENFISTNPSGSQVMAQIDLLRETARNIRKQDAPKKKALAEARTSLGIANALEAMIERSLDKSGNADLLSQYRDGRKLSAKSFVAEDIIDFNTGKARVADLAKMTSGDTALNGAMADLGKIYGNFPEALRIKEGGFGLADISKTGQTHFLRAGVPGTIGAVIGSPFGMTVPTAAAAALLGEITGSRYAKKMVTPEFQKYNAIPTDYRPAPVPISQPTPTSTIPVPYVSQGEFQRGGSGSPNWVPGRATGIDPDVQPSMVREPGLLGFTPNAEMQRPRGFPNANMWAERAAQAAEAAEPRRPASGGVLYDLDPITGRLRPVDQGLKGATPAAVESTGNNLSSAVNKISSGQKFAMSSEERIAWDKSKVDLGKAASELRGLSDDAIASRVADRQWVANRIQELKTEYADWAKGVGERFRAEQVGRINERANNPPVLTAYERQMRKQMNAEASRRIQLEIETRKAKMQADIDALERMSDEMNVQRPSGGLLGQGPKTRAAQRNQSGLLDLQE